MFLHFVTKSTSGTERFAADVKTRVHGVWPSWVPLRPRVSCASGSQAFSLSLSLPPPLPFSPPRSRVRLIDTEASPSHLPYLPYGQIPELSITPWSLPVPQLFPPHLVIHSLPLLIFLDSFPLDLMHFSCFPPFPPLYSQVNGDSIGG